MNGISIKKFNISTPIPLIVFNYAVAHSINLDNKKVVHINNISALSHHSKVLFDSNEYTTQISYNITFEWDDYSNMNSPLEAYQLSTSLLNQSISSGEFVGYLNNASIQFGINTFENVTIVSSPSYSSYYELPTSTEEVQSMGMKDVLPIIFIITPVIFFVYILSLNIYKAKYSPVKTNENDANTTNATIETSDIELKIDISSTETTTNPIIE